MATQNHKGKIALITGANKGIGYELARQLAKEGVTVLIAARNAELGDAAAGKLKADGADVYFIELDVTKPDTIAKAAQTIRSQHGRLDILVNNAELSTMVTAPPAPLIPRPSSASLMSIFSASYLLHRPCCRSCVILLLGVL